ncbi:MAG: putative quinol monooxygenase [Actinomycetota bacterium]
MPRVAVFAKLVAKAGREADLVRALEALFPAANANPGTHVFAMHQSDEDSTVIWFYELHEDLETLEEQDRAAQRILGARLDALLAEPPEVLVSRPLQAKGLPD